MGLSLSTGPPKSQPVQFNRLFTHGEDDDDVPWDRQVHYLAQGSHYELPSTSLVILKLWNT